MYRFAVISIAVLAAFAPAAAAASSEVPGETFPVSVSAVGDWADGEGAAEYTPVSISADGRYVAFQSASANLGEAGPTGVIEGFVKDLDTGAVSLASRADGPGGEAAGAPGIFGLELSADGRFAIFTSAATNLGTALPGEEAGETHVYRRDLVTGETTLVDRVSGVGGAILSRGAEAASISAAGRYVAFTARVENLEEPAGNHAETANAVAYVRDMDTGATTAVSRASGTEGEIGDAAAEWPSISPDGHLVVFASTASNLVPGVDEGVWQQVYLRNLETDTTTLVSQNALGAPGDRSSSLPFISGAQGCFVTFSSIAYNLLEPAPLEVSGEQVYVADLCASPPTVTLASQSATEPIAPFAYSVAAANDAGDEAIFAAEFASSPCCHLYLRDLAAGETTQLDRASGPAGTPANAEVQQFALSGNGCRAVFASRATNLYGGGPPQGPGEEPTEVYVRQLKPCAAPADDHPAAGDSKESQAAGPSTRQAASPMPAVGKLRVDDVGRRGVLLSLTAPGQVTVRLRRFTPTPRRHWKLIQVIEAASSSPGRLEVPLPSLDPGRYRLNIHLHGTPHGTVRWLTVAPSPARSYAAPPAPARGSGRVGSRTSHMSGGLP